MDRMGKLLAYMLVPIVMFWKHGTIVTLTCQSCPQCDNLMVRWHGSGVTKCMRCGYDSRL